LDRTLPENEGAEKSNGGLRFLQMTFGFQTYIVSTFRHKLSMESTAAKRIPSLDGLRAMSILLVIVGHFYQSFMALAIFGVHIFFVISGYLITKLLQDEYDRRGRIALGSFYRRRAFRIFPAAYAYIIIIALLAPVSRP